MANDLNSKSELYHDWTKVTRLIGGLDRDLILGSYTDDIKWGIKKPPFLVVVFYFVMLECYTCLPNEVYRLLFVLT